MTTTPARDVFLKAINKIYSGVDPKNVHEVTSAELSVPGFVALEVASRIPLRGWANGETAVLARLQNFGPVLEALGFRDDARSPSAQALADLLLWLHGPPYERVDHVARGEYGAKEDLELAPVRERRYDDSVILRFGMKDPASEDEPASILHYVIVGHPDEMYRIDIDQVAPLVD
jgi:hypothetical protein